MDNGVDGALLNAYVFLAEIIAQIIWQTYNAKRKEPLKIRYEIIMESFVAFCVYLSDIINTQYQMTGIEVIYLIGISICAGLMLGYVAELTVYIGSLFFNFVYKSLKKK